MYRVLGFHQGLRAGFAELRAQDLRMSYCHTDMQPKGGPNQQNGMIMA